MIVLDDVSYAHAKDKKPFIEHCSLHIPVGEWVTIAGPNGSGKSTLVKLWNGLLTKRSGQIWIDGIELQTNTVDVIRERIGFVFQNPDNQFVGLTVADDLAFGLENRRLPQQIIHQRIAEYADKLDIVDLLDRHPSELSGGQKQRVAIAAVLALEPKVVVFDEATAMLDELSKAEVLKLMGEMRDTGQYTIVSVTHDEEEMLASDRLLLMVDGAIIANETPAQVFANKEWLEAARLNPPYVLQLCKELQRRGIEIEDCVDERKLVDALWAYYLTM